ncbi:hypothetical protein FT663_01809 [Candidozyma haemuli var. vulneris]|nr:hypothetical protein FT662_01897 [[Candida] haemuloni var. vulneris]KAF3993641.1 hypothetical protein FT663_01809 [[Candida] haemuloni var. vulneris]
MGFAATRYTTTTTTMLHGAMDVETFNKALPAFHKLAVEHLTSNVDLHVESNYVKSYSGKWCSFISLRLDQTNLEFVVSYNEFYQEPVLHHLRDHNPGITVDIEQCFPEVHPVLQRTFLFLHQCETKELMQSLEPKSPVRYLVSWFGIYLSYIDAGLSLRVPEQAYTSVLS